MIYPIIPYGDPVLRKVAKPVDFGQLDVLKLADDMFETMYEAPGVGLAAVQIGVTQRIVTMDPARGDEEKAPLALINPEIIWSSDTTSEYEEGCLSIPDFYGVVTRPEKVGVRYIDLDGKQFEREMAGFAATIIQHEIDHLEGRLFIDHLSRLKRERVLKKFQKLARREGGE